jgi:hypothetical protein
MTRVRFSGDRYDSQILEALQTSDSPIHDVIQNEASQVGIRKSVDVRTPVSAVVNINPYLLRGMQDCCLRVAPDG